MESLIVMILIAHANIGFLSPQIKCIIRTNIYAYKHAHPCSGVAGPDIAPVRSPLRLVLSN